MIYKYIKAEKWLIGTLYYRCSLMLPPKLLWWEFDLKPLDLVTHWRVPQYETKSRLIAVFHYTYMFTLLFKKFKRLNVAENKRIKKKAVCIGLQSFTRRLKYLIVSYFYPFIIVHHFNIFLLIVNIKSSYYLRYKYITKCKTFFLQIHNREWNIVCNNKYYIKKQAYQKSRQ